MQSTSFKAALIALALSISAPAVAVPDYEKIPFNFACFSGDCSTNVGGQLKLEVIGDKNGEDANVYFKFFNLIGTPSSVTKVGFEGWDTFAVFGNTGSNFAFDAAPLVLLGAPNFVSEWAASATDGMNSASDILEITAGDSATLGAHPDYLTYVTRMQSGEFRVGLQVEGIGAGGINGDYVNLANPVPEPGTWALLLAGLLGVGAVVRRRMGQS